MPNPPVVFIAFNEFENLGIGYLASVLSEAGYESILIDFDKEKEEICRILKMIDPIIVGFSVIFQYHIYEFEELIKFLRKEKIICHFTAGGQYSSLRYRDLLEVIPSLDSVVRFEGEYTFLDLVNCISTGNDWKNISGIAYKNSDKIIVNSLRPVETDLDKFPFPRRSPLKEFALDKKFATLLAGRGCVNNCSFCFLREYYQESSGPSKRIRKPEKVVEEMELLYHEMACSVFLFEDDDFPVRIGNSSEWIERFCKELKHKNLIDRIMWKINCRPDEVDYESFEMMKRHGLFLVFMGIEDGTDDGLTWLNKHMTVKRCLGGINILKKLDIGFDYGFMLFQPSSTYSSIKENLNFLQEICGDGFSPVTYLKMMPYCATRVEKELRKEGRLKGIPGFYDYDFLDESMNHYYVFIRDCLNDWIGASDGLSNISKWARNYLSVFSHYFEMSPGVHLVSSNVKTTVSESNLFLINILKELSTLFETGRYNSDNYEDLGNFREIVNLKHNHFREQINNSMSNLLEIVERQKILKSVSSFS
jgi:anaerobic magnesium-protoporphyrin IX monomethyl ester cyclase